MPQRNLLICGCGIFAGGVLGLCLLGLLGQDAFAAGDATPASLSAYEPPLHPLLVAAGQLLATLLIAFAAEE